MSPTVTRRNSARTRTSIARAVVVAGLLLILAGCAAGVNDSVGSGEDAAGFWLGLWQGFIVPVTFVISLFTDEVNVYEVTNNGNWYDFGFVIGVSAIFSGMGGSGAATARSAK